MREEFGTYRGKSIEDNEWVYGYFFNNANQSLIFPKSNLPVEYLDTVPVYPETVGRRLAWNDDKGNPLYQGDIVSVNDRYIAIVVNDYSLVLNGKLRQEPYTDRWIVYKGNVFDNPEFLSDLDLTAFVCGCSCDNTEPQKRIDTLVEKYKDKDICILGCYAYDFEQNFYGNYFCHNMKKSKCKHLAECMDLYRKENPEMIKNDTEIVLDIEELDRVYSSLEAVYPKIAAYESRSALFRKGVKDGYISQAVCDYAEKFYGRLWNYVGD